MKSSGASWIVCAVLSLSACATARREAVNPAPSGEWIVKVDGAVASGAREFAMPPEELQARFSELARRGRVSAADRLVARHSDAARALLRDSKSPAAELAPIAAAYERVAGVADGAWSARAASGAAVTDLDVELASRREALSRAHEAAAFQAQSVDRKARVSVDEIARLDGIRLLLTGNFAAAVDVLDRGVQRTRTIDAETSAEFSLLASAAAARLGDEAGAARAWTSGVESLATLAQRTSPVRAAALVERAVALRPATTPWPDGVLRSAETSSARVLGAELGFDDASSDAAALALLAAFRLDRGESEAALLAYARAQSKAGDERTRAQLRIGQAKALAKSRRDDDARALLANLAGSTDEAVARPAWTLLAALEIARGRYESAEAILERVLAAQDAGARWPSRWSARANFASLLVSRGEFASAELQLAGAREDALLLGCAEAVDAVDEQRAGS